MITKIPETIRKLEHFHCSNAPITKVPYLHKLKTLKCDNCPYFERMGRRR